MFICNCLKYKLPSVGIVDCPGCKARYQTVRDDKGKIIEVERQDSGSWIRQRHIKIEEDKK